MADETFDLANPPTDTWRDEQDRSEWFEEAASYWAARAVEKVWVGVVEHKHGTNFYVSATEAGLNRQLSAYCREWWNHDELGEQPEADEDVIVAYFDDENANESFVVQEVELD